MAGISHREQEEPGIWVERHTGRSKEELGDSLSCVSGQNCRSAGFFLASLSQQVFTPHMNDRDLVTRHICSSGRAGAHGTGRPVGPWPEQWCGTDCGPGELQKVVKISVDSVQLLGER